MQAASGAACCAGRARTLSGTSWLNEGPKEFLVAPGQLTTWPRVSVQATLHPTRGPGRWSRPASKCPTRSRGPSSAVHPQLSIIALQRAWPELPTRQDRDPSRPARSARHVPEGAARGMLPSGHSCRQCGPGPTEPTGCGPGARSVRCARPEDTGTGDS